MLIHHTQIHLSTGKTYNVMFKTREADVLSRLKI